MHTRLRLSFPSVISVLVAFYAWFSVLNLRHAITVQNDVDFFYYGFPFPFYGGTPGLSAELSFYVLPALVNAIVLLVIAIPSAMILDRILTVTSPTVRRLAILLLVLITLYNVFVFSFVRTVGVALNTSTSTRMLPFHPVAFVVGHRLKGNFPYEHSTIR